MENYTISYCLGRKHFLRRGIFVDRLFIRHHIGAGIVVRSLDILDLWKFRLFNGNSEFSFQFRVGDTTDDMDGNATIRPHTCSICVCVLPF